MTSLFSDRNGNSCSHDQRSFGFGFEEEEVAEVLDVLEEVEADRSAASWSAGKKSSFRLRRRFNAPRSVLRNCRHTWRSGARSGNPTRQSRRRPPHNSAVLVAALKQTLTLTQQPVQTRHKKTKDDIRRQRIRLLVALALLESVLESRSTAAKPRARQDRTRCKGRRCLYTFLLCGIIQGPLYA